MDRPNVEDAPRPIIETNRFGIAGMTCGDCVRKIKNALRKVEAVHQVMVARQRATATVTFDRARTDMPVLHGAGLLTGYKPSR